MRWMTWVDGAQATVELLEVNTGGAVRARIEPIASEQSAEAGPARELRFDLHRAAGEGGLHVLLADGRGLPARIAGSEVVLGDLRFAVKAVSERDAWLGAGVDEHHEGEVTVSMPGLCVKLLAEVGRAVDKGEPLLIVEAMKMENEVKAGRAGIITAIHVEPGQPVQADRVLMEIGDA